MIELNLLPSQKALSAREKLARQILLSFLGLLSVVLVADLLIFLLFSQLFARQVNDLTNARTRLLSEAQQYKIVAENLRTVQEKAAGITVVLRERPDFPTMISDVVKLLVDGVELGDFQVNEAGAVTFSAKARDVESLGAFIARINDFSSQTKLTKIILSGLSQDVSSRYAFQISAEYQLSSKNQ